MAVDLTQIGNVQEIIKQIETQENKARKDHSYKARQIMEGAQAKYVRTELARLYPKTHTLMRVSDISLLKKIVGKIAKAYKEDPLRILDSDDETERYSQLVKDAHFNKQFQVFDRYFVRDKHAALWVNKIEDQFHLIPLAAFEFDVIIEEKTNKLDTMILTYDRKDFKEYAIWTEFHHVLVRSHNSAIEYIPIEGNPGHINPLGIIPFSYRSSGDGRGYPVASPLADQSTTMNDCDSLLYFDQIDAVFMTLF